MIAGRHSVLRHHGRNREARVLPPRPGCIRDFSYATSAVSSTLDRGFIPIVVRSDAMNDRIMTTIHAMGLADSLSEARAN